MAEFTIELIGAPYIKNGTAKAKVLLSVAGVQKVVETVRLDSARAIAATATQWAKVYNLDNVALAQQLHRASIYAAGLAVEQAEKAKAVADKHIWDVAGQWLKTLKPLWHRNGRSLFLEATNQEVPLSKMWTTATPELIELARDTAEGAQTKGSFRGILGILKDALEIAAHAAVANVPEVDFAPKTIIETKPELAGQLINWLGLARVYRTDYGAPITTTYWEWASSIGEVAWKQCHTDMVFARKPKDADEVTPPDIAVKGEKLAHDLKYKSLKKLASDLKNSGLVTKSDFVLRCSGKVWRAWLLSAEVHPAKMECPSDLADNA